MMVTSSFLDFWKIVDVLTSGAASTSFLWLSIRLWMAHAECPGIIPVIIIALIFRAAVMAFAACFNNAGMSSCRSLPEMLFS